MNSIIRIKEAQRLLDFTNRQLAVELRVSEFWLSKVLRGHRPASADLMLRLDDLARRKNIVLTTNYDATARPTVEAPSDGPEQAVAELLKETGAATADAELRHKIFTHLQSLLRAAGNDVQRLGWIAEQLRQHVREPASWTLKERLLEEAIAKQRAREAAEAQSQISKSEKGRTG